jgi:nitroreductase
MQGWIGLQVMGEYHSAMTSHLDSASITAVIRQRFSCRNYLDLPIEAEKQEKLLDFINGLPPGPFGSHPRFKLVAATKEDNIALKGLGTYGFIRNPDGFIIGAAVPHEKYLEDFGFLMESIILFATRLSLGTCWLGGSFTRSSFAEKISLQEDEQIPAAVSIGEFVDNDKNRSGLIRRFARGDRRLPWGRLFFDKGFDHPLDKPGEDSNSTALEMVRLAPSASNKQPWRVVREGSAFHFYLQRTPGYTDSLLKKALGIVDLQRVDMGIALCHFDLSMNELGIKGDWVVEEPSNKKLNELTEYITSWVAGDIGNL